MRVPIFKTLLVASALIAPLADAQADDVPPNVMDTPADSDGKLTIDRPRAEGRTANPAVNSIFDQTPAIGDTQTIIPLAPQSDNASNNLPVDRTAPN